MKTVYPIVALFSAALVAAGPLPANGNISNGKLAVRTAHLVEPAPTHAPAPDVDAAAAAHKAAADKAAADKAGE